MGPWCSYTVLFLVVSNDRASLSTEILEINVSFEYGLVADFFKMLSEGLSSISTIVLECVSAVNDFY